MFDARCFPRPAMVAVSGGPYTVGHSPWRQHAPVQRHQMAVEASHPGPMLSVSVALRHTITGAILPHVGLGAALKYFGVQPH